MVGESGYKRYVGATLIYRALDITTRHSPIILRRNINTVLNAHATDLQEQEQTRKHVASANSTTIDQPAMATASDLPRTWKTPDKSMLERLTRGHKPILRIHPKEFRLPQTPVPSGPTQQTASSLDWLPAPDVDSIRCNVSCGIYEKVTSKHVIIEQQKQSTILTCTKDQHGHKHLHLNLEEPFLIPVAKLTTKVSEGTSATGARRWKQTVWTSYVVKISVSCTNSEDSSLLLSLVDLPPDPAKPSTINECNIRMRWKKLPDCLPDGQMLAAWCGPQQEANGKSRLLSYQLDVDMGWTEATESSVLESYNRATTLARNVDPIPTTTRTAEAPRDHRITYIFTSSTGQARTNVVDGLKCIYCPSRRTYTSFERLHLHYVVNHEHFKFSVKDGGVHGGLAQKSISIDIADKVLIRASNDVSDEREFHWIRPTRPFDVDQFLRGDETWMTGKVGVRKKKVKSPAEDLSSNTSFRPVSKRVKEPGDVGELPSKKRKRHIVPDIPGITLYRNISKREIHPGESLSESDDDVEDSWIAHHNKLRKINSLPESTQEFLRIFDSHMDDEELRGDLYVPDALVRLCRRHGHELSKPLILQEFKVKLRQLRQTGIIKHRTYRYCLDSIHDAAHSSDKLDKDNHANSHRDDQTRDHPAASLHDEDGDVDMTNGITEREADAATTQRHGSSISKKQIIPQEKLRRHVLGLEGDENFGRRNPVTAFSSSAQYVTPGTQPPTNGLTNGTSHTEVTNDVPNRHQRQDSQITNGHHVHDHPPNGLPEPRTGMPEPIRLAACVCGMIVERPRGAIVCIGTNEIPCPHDQFHLSCVGLPKRVPNWRCPDCRAVF